MRVLAAGLVLVALVVNVLGLLGGARDVGAEEHLSVIITAPADFSATAETTLTVEFEGSELAATYTCSLDSATAVACTSPHILSGLAVGQHTFEVVAFDSFGSSSQPAIVNFAVVALTPVGDLGIAMTTDPALVTGASYLTVATPPYWDHEAVATQVRTAAVGSFPRAGMDYAVLSSGDAGELTDTTALADTSFGTGPFRGDTDFDVTVLKVDVLVPVDAVCLAFDFRFYSEEYPEFVGSAYNDAFIAEFDQSTWTTSASTITAPDNFASDPNGDVISINSSGATSMTDTEAAGTPYDGATPLLTAATETPPGPHSLYLSIFDQGDTALDSTVLVDNLRTSTSSAGCTEGATVVAPITAVDDTATTTRDVPAVIDVLANDTGVTGQVVTAAVESAPANGSALVNGDNTITYIPAAGFVGTDTFTYSVNESLPATVTVTVSAPSSDPVAPTEPDPGTIVVPPPTEPTPLPEPIEPTPLPDPVEPVEPGEVTDPATADTGSLAPPAPTTSPTGSTTSGSQVLGNVFTGIPPAAPAEATDAPTAEPEGELADEGEGDEVAAPGAGNGGSGPDAAGAALDEPLVVATSDGTLRAAPGGELRLAGTGYQGCDDVFVFFDGKRIGTASPDRAGNLTLQGLAVPGGTKPGEHLVTTSCSRSGEPVVQEAVFEVTDTSSHRTGFVTSLTKSGQVDLSLKQLLITALLTLAFIVLIAFPADLFNGTFEENYDEIRRKLRLPQITSSDRPRSSLMRWGGFVAFVGVTAIGYGLIEPGYGLDASSLALTLGLFLGLLVLVGLVALPGEVYLWRTGDHGSLALLPASLVVAALCVVLSRAMGFQPGYLYGALAGIAFASALNKRSEGRLALLSGLFMLGVSVVAWLVWSRVAGMADDPQAGFWIFVAEAALATVFACGIETAAFSMLPMRFMAGGKVVAWSRRMWLVGFGLAMFAFLLLIVRPNAGYVSGGGNRAMVLMMLAFGGFGLFSVLFWAYFRFRGGGEDDRLGETLVTAEL